MADDSDFWRGWNSRVAQQWNAYDQGQAAPTPYFGDYQRDYDYSQQVAALPPAQRMKMQDDAFQNRLALAQEGRLLSGQQFNQAVDRERLRMDMEAAKRKGMVDPFENAATRMQALERGFGVNPLEALAIAESTPDWQKTGSISFPGRWQLNPMTGKPEQLPGKQFPYNPQTHAYFSQLRSQMIPGYTQADPSSMAAQAPSVNPTPQATQGLTPEEQMRLNAYQAKLRAGAGSPFPSSLVNDSQRGRLMQFITQ